MDKLVTFAYTLAQENKTKLSRTVRISRPKIISYLEGEPISNLDHRIRIAKYARSQIQKLNKEYELLKNEIERIINSNEW